MMEARRNKLILQAMRLRQRRSGGSSGGGAQHARFLGEVRAARLAGCAVLQRSALGCPLLKVVAALPRPGRGRYRRVWRLVIARMMLL